MTIRLRPIAVRDLVDARVWYEERGAGLGKEFVDAVAAVFDRIDAFPNQFPKIRGETRRALVHRFPFLIYFRVDGNDRFILAVLHQATNPARLRRR